MHQEKKHYRKKFLNKKKHNKLITVVFSISAVIFSISGLIMGLIMWSHTEALDLKIFYIIILVLGGLLFGLVLGFLINILLIFILKILNFICKFMS